MGMKKIITSILKDIKTNQTSNYEKIKNKIVYKLVNYKENEKLLSDLPYILFLDMAIIFYILPEEIDRTRKDILICKEHLKIWKVKQNEIYQQAKKNTPILLPYKIKDTKNILQECETIGGVSNCYILTNQNNWNGACCILYENILKSFAEKQNSNIIIIFFSIHEVLLVSEDERINRKELFNVVKPVNKGKVKKEEQLSNSIYLYEFNTEEFKIIK